MTVAQATPRCCPGVKMRDARLGEVAYVTANFGRMSALREPVPFEVYEAGVYLHGTKADLAVGDLLVSGRESNFEAGRVMNYIYSTATLDAAVWGAELARGDGQGRIYVVEPTGEFEDDPNVTDKKFPGNPTQSFRSREPLRVVDELVDWVGHSREKLQAMQDDLRTLKRRGAPQIKDGGRSVAPGETPQSRRIAVVMSTSSPSS